MSRLKDQNATAVENQTRDVNFSKQEKANKIFVVSGERQLDIIVINFLFFFEEFYYLIINFLKSIHK